MEDASTTVTQQIVGGVEVDGTGWSRVRGSLVLVSACLASEEQFLRFQRSFVSLMVSRAGSRKWGFSIASWRVNLTHFSTPSKVHLHGS